MNKDIVLDTLKIAGELGLHLLDKDNFELYLVALELRDVDNPIEPVTDLLVFPINPESITKIQKTLVNVKKSFSGVHVFDSDTFVPFPINLTGNFGAKKFKYLFGAGLGSVAVKTGFGVTKMLSNLIEKSRTLTTKGKPYRLLLHLLPLSESYTVVVNECRYTQGMEKNRIWTYDLNLTAVAPPLQKISNAQLFGAYFVQKVLNKVNIQFNDFV